MAVTATVTESCNRTWRSGVRLQPADLLRAPPALIRVGVIVCRQEQSMIAPTRSEAANGHE
jgi:hypothetical protein